MRVREQEGMEMVTEMAIREFLARMIANGIVQRFEFDNCYRICNGYKVEPEKSLAPITDFDWDRAFDLDYLRERAEKNTR